MFKRILLPLDGSVLAEQALPYAIAQAERFEATLVLLRVLEPIAESRGLSRRAVRQAEEMIWDLVIAYLDSIAARLHERDIPVEVETIAGQPHVKIVEFAEANDIHLIVMCTRGRSGLSRWLMGSTADRVARGVRVPILLVPPSQTDGEEHEDDAAQDIR